ncbi:hypothetical protein BSL78_29337 [Apostichopus japonicus]|uniref:Uncharacterized protein n=1 Tax=Stichopus japonicus TaxID=307972 RepID=A0A2G8JDN6_STIJA|nr:hypothetical protein BSL78_29337 [Apostichopus japonicus]
MDESTKDDDDDEETAQTYHLLLMMKEAFEPLKLGEVCYELGSLTQFEKCVDIMEEYHAHVLVLEMMESLRLNSDNQLAGLCTINSMMKASQKLLTLIEKQNIVSVITDILGRYEDDPQIQSTIFQTISILAEFGE